MNNVSILITTFNRNHLLNYGLSSINYKNQNYEILVLNDGEDDYETKDICKRHNASYIWTGKNKHAKWRVPGFALNIGAKLAKYDWLLISCAEMYHINNCLEKMLLNIYSRELVICNGWDDDGRFLTSLENNTDFDYKKLNSLRTQLPFLMLIHKKWFYYIRGYDEDFLGQSYDDDDLVTRLQGVGCYYKKIDTHCVHLYHDRNIADKRDKGRLNFNYKLFQERKNILIRNRNKIWGQL